MYVQIARDEMLLVAVVLMAALGTLLLGRWIRSRGRRLKVRVVGVGGGGANTLDALRRTRTRNVDYVAINTDLDELRRATGRKLPIGKTITNGLGGGGDPTIGASAAREASDRIGRVLSGADLVVVTAGLGGGTGSGAAPVIAGIARQQGALVVGVVTKPFDFEGTRRRSVADAASAELLGAVDAVATFPNERVRDLLPADASVEAAFRAADDAMCRSIRELINLIAVPGRISLDFSTVRAILAGGGAALVGIGRASGENRAVDAAREAVAAAHLDGRLEGATSILLHVAGSRTLRLAELNAITEEVLRSAAPDANVAFGMKTDRRLRDAVQVAVIATGFARPAPTLAGATAPTDAATEEQSWRPVWLRERSASGSTEAEATPRPRTRKRGPARQEELPGPAAT